MIFLGNRVGWGGGVKRGPSVYSRSAKASSQDSSHAFYSRRIASPGGVHRVILYYYIPLEP